MGRKRRERRRKKKREKENKEERTKNQGERVTDLYISKVEAPCPG